VNCVGSWLTDQDGLDRLELELLLGHILGLNRSQIIAHPERPLTAAETTQLSCMVTRLRDGEPLAYITGVREFWSLPFQVSPAVLIPRPDTELLVASALERLAADAAQHPQVLDLGTGSGIIAICLARYGSCEVTAVDVSEQALAVARSNAISLEADVRFLQSDWFDQVDARYQMIVSNPPYVAESDAHLGALRCEPATALVAGPDGLDELQTIISTAPAYLLNDGWLLLEHGYDQGNAVRQLLKRAGFDNIETLQDLGRRDRVSVARWTSP
jgi:release factor glutamine methyltransferase